MHTFALHLRGHGSLRSPGQSIESSLVPYSFESLFFYSGLSTRFGVAESHTHLRYAGSRFVHLPMRALEPRFFRVFFPSLRTSRSRAFDLTLVSR
jgi:hypothetical protein